MKKMLRFAFVVLLASSSLVAFNGCGGGNNNNTTGTDSSSTTITTDTTSNMNKMSDSGAMNRMTGSTKKDTGGRNTQDVPPPKPKRPM
ncbi:MAG: hypothetical protein M3R72_08680 [Bacteroidota bacterium]|nr:hypothetical protein [Bacteroidota bacterium]